jgi:hypothetical protein
MKKTIIIITILLVSLLASCSSNKHAKLLYTINGTTNLNMEELFTHIKSGVDVSIWYVDELDSDYVKNLITEDMSNEEIDEIIKRFRDNKKEYYLNKGSLLALKIGLKDISLDFTIYEYSPSIGLTFKHINFDIFEQILKLSDLDDIVEIQFYEY